MKNLLYKTLPYLALVTFLLYWTFFFVLSMPSNFAKDFILKKAPRIKLMYVSSWKLFTPPGNYCNRLYCIVRSINSGEIPDTVEVLANVSFQKQIKAPFNQRETIIDYLINKNVVDFTNEIWGNKKNEAPYTTKKPDSADIARAIADVENTKSYKMHLGNLNNYLMIILKEKNIDTLKKEIKILIKQKMIRPFKEMDNARFLEDETTVFETPFKPIHP